jgi:uncharacterized membrane protein YbaN (DUF454 family)
MNARIRIKRITFLVLGLACLVFSYFGIIMPGVPAIPFILLAAWFFLQSSEKLYEWLYRRKIIGKVLQKYFSKEKLHPGAKWFVISQLWVSLILAQILFISQPLYFIIINVVGLLSSVIIYKLLNK